MLMNSVKLHSGESSGKMLSAKLAYKVERVKPGGFKPEDCSIARRLSPKAETNN